MTTSNQPLGFLPLQDLRVGGSATANIWVSGLCLHLLRPGCHAVSAPSPLLATTIVDPFSRTILPVTMVGLLSLSDDIILPILHSCDNASTVAMAWTCRRFYNIIVLSMTDLLQIERWPQHDRAATAGKCPRK